MMKVFHGHYDVAFKNTVLEPSETMLRKHLVRAKDSVPIGKQYGVEYMIPCSDCDSVYIGETRRAIQERIRNTKETSVLDYLN